MRGKRRQTGSVIPIVRRLLVAAVQAYSFAADVFEPYGSWLAESVTRPREEDVMTKYYEPEHFEGYARIRREGLDQWNDLHPDDRGGGYNNFSNREFLAAQMPQAAGLGLSVLEYGCGTGSAACFLAERGYRVHAVDLVPDAIAIARERAAQRGLRVRFDVQDICEWRESDEQYDFVVDAFCLNSIVIDEDRARVLNGVRRRLNSGGRYLLSTSVYRPDREYGEEHYDAGTGIVWVPTAGPGEAALLLDGTWYLPHRRHLTSIALRAELADHGFRVLDLQEPFGANLVCELS
jgi:2-polyprenyl-3-methyl-5-hydroxy-6-metoxy-1,4-benzoquinol methylase